MPKFKQGIDRYQEVLIPKGIVDRIQDKHLAKLVVSICDILQNEVYQIKAIWGE